MEKYNRKRLNSFVFYYISHGANIQGVDCLIETTGHPTSVKSIMKLFEEKIIAEKYFLIMDCCRNPMKPQHPLNKDHKTDYHPSIDTNMTRVYAAQPLMKTPDIADNTLTSAIVELLKREKKVKVKRLQRELMKIWDRKQVDVKHTPDVVYTPRKEETLFPRIRTSSRC